MLFIRRNQNTVTDSLARYFPGGRLFASRTKEGSNLRMLLSGIATEMLRANDLIKQYNDEIIPDETERFIDEWEQALGIPDSCFNGTGTIAERRRDVLVKLASLGVQTNQDFVDLAEFFGVTVTIQNGTIHGLFPLTFPIILFDSTKAARNTIIVTIGGTIFEEVFPWEFPYTFGDTTVGLLECLFSSLKPATSDLIFEQV